MKLPVEWLKEHNKKITDVHNLIHKLTLAGIECELIDHNKKKFKQYDVDFRVLDITKNDLPEAEICFLRQVLQHLSNNSILSFIRLLKKNINTS